MDKLELYREIICNFLTEYGQIPPLGGDIESETVLDKEKDRYLLVHLGWKNQQRIYSTVFHLDICDGKIWIQRNQTDFCLADDLIARGVAREDIVLGLQPAFVRKYTGLGVT